MMLKSLTRMMIASIVLTLSACWSGEKTGPEDVHWDRDVCELCKMFISDPRFVAEVRGGEKRKLYKFDDIGCAVNWLNAQTWAGDPTTEIWVAGEGSTRENVVWLNAREARYARGKFSPMNYNYTAIPASQAGPDSIDFVAMTNGILAKGPNHICRTPERHK